jgi:hypothetical protein
VHCPNLKRNLLFSFLVVLAACAAPRLTAAPDTPEIANARHSVRIWKNEDGSCSVVVVAPGRALTAEHCRVLLEAGRIEGLRVAGMERIGDTDSATITVPGLACPCAPMASEPAALGDQVLVVGYPYGAGRVLAWGVVQEDPIVGELAGLRFALVPVAPGNSGGGVFNASGRLLGIVSMGFKGYPGMLYVELPL